MHFFKLLSWFWVIVGSISALPQSGRDTSRGQFELEMYSSQFTVYHVHIPGSTTTSYQCQDQPTFSKQLWANREEEECSKMCAVDDECERYEYFKWELICILHKNPALWGQPDGSYFYCVPKTPGKMSA